MGTNNSKQSEAAVHTQKSDLDVDSTSDPRSPTPEIVRTPLQGKAGTKHNITKNADLRKNFEKSKDDEKLIHNNPILSAVIKNHLLSYDPRSPTQEFERTPIIIASKIEDFANDRKMQMSNAQNCGSPWLRKGEGDEHYDSCAEAQDSPERIVPKKLCNGFLDLTLNDSIKDNEPLGSSTASNEAIENNISKGTEMKETQLLETNFDYVEKIDECQEATIDNFQPEEYDLEKIPVYKILDDDPRSPTVGIERTPIVVSKSDNEIVQENVEEMSDESLIKALQSTNTGLRQSVKSCDGIDGGLLIYEDESNNINDTPKKYKSDVHSGSRTPLSCVKNKETGHSRSKSVIMLQDQKKEKKISTKFSKKVSHIPRLKSLTRSKFPQNGNPLNGALVISGDCENTPPHSHRDRWDKDNSIVL